MRSHLIDYVLWCLTPVLMTTIAVCMFRKRLHRDFPFFFAYVVFQVVSFAVEFPLRHWAYFYWVSWTTYALNVLAIFAVLLEVPENGLRPYKALRDLCVLWFCWCIPIALLVGGIWVIASWRTNEIGNIFNAIFLVDRNVRTMQCGLALLILLFSGYLGISRRSIFFGIYVGFGFYEVVHFLVLTALTHRTVIEGVLLRRVNGAAYLVAMLIWLAFAALSAQKSSLRGV